MTSPRTRLDEAALRTLGMNEVFPGSPCLLIRGNGALLGDDTADQRLAPGNRFQRITVMRNAVLLTLAVILFARPASAQNPRLDALDVDASAFPAVRATFELRLPSGELADSVSDADTRITEGTQVSKGKIEASGKAAGAAYLFVIDTSGSMRAILPEVRGALGAFVESLGQKDKAAILVFNDEPKLIHPFSADKGSLNTNLEGMTPGGKSTQLYFAVTKALEHFEQPGLPSRRVLVAVTDGKDEGTAYTLDDVIQKAQQARAAIVGFGITSGEKKYLLNLQRMAEKTSGLYLSVETGQNWTEKVALARRHVESRFTVSWASALPPDGESHPVRLEVSRGAVSASADLTVKTPLVLAWWQRPVTWAACAGGLLLAALIVWLIVRSRKKHRAEVEELSRALESEKQQRADVERQIGKGLEEVKGKIDGLESKTATAAPVPPTVPPASPSQKRRTEFLAGTPATVTGPEAYRNALLEVLAGAQPGSRLPLPPGQTTLGRDDDNNIVIDDEKSSLHHAAIRCEEGVFWVSDLGSTNGTFIDETRLSGRAPLSTGQRIRIGRTVFVFRGEK